MPRRSVSAPGLRAPTGTGETVGRRTLGSFRRCSLEDRSSAVGEPGRSTRRPLSVEGSCRREDNWDLGWETRTGVTSETGRSGREGVGLSLDTGAGGWGKGQFHHRTRRGGVATSLGPAVVVGSLVVPTVSRGYSDAT